MLKSTAVERPKQTIIQAAAIAYAMQHRKLIPRRINMNKLAKHLATLADDQQCRMDEQRPVSPVPLIWVALANSVGISVDIETGRIIDGPKEQISSLEKLALEGFPVNKKPASPRPPVETL